MLLFDLTSKHSNLLTAASLVRITRPSPSIVVPPVVSDKTNVNLRDMVAGDPAGKTVASKVIVSDPGLLFASIIACLSDPTPSSFVFVTTKLAAETDPGVVKMKDTINKNTSEIEIIFHRCINTPPLREFISLFTAKTEKPTTSRSVSLLTPRYPSDHITVNGSKLT
jgi:hypothetical protein